MVCLAGGGFWDFEGGSVGFRRNLYVEVWQRLGVLKWLVGRGGVVRVVDCLVVGWPVGVVVDVGVFRVLAVGVCGRVFGCFSWLFVGLVLDVCLVLREWWLVRVEFRDEFVRWRGDIVGGVCFDRGLL